MKKKPTLSTSATELRHQAEEKLSARKKKNVSSPTTEADAQRLLHELQVHQIELEMQNEELMRAHAEAEEAYHKYIDLYDFAPVGYFTLTPEGTIHEVNLAGAILLGVERVNLINRHLGLFASVKSRAAFRAFFEMLLSGVGKETYELAFLKNKSELIWVRVEATCFEGGQESRAVMVDITESKRVDEELRRSEEHFKNLAEGLPDAVYTLDLSTQTVTYFNQEGFLGYSRSELMAEHSILSEFHPKDATAALHKQKQTMNGETLSPFEYRVRNKTGDWEWVESRWVVQRRNTERTPTQIMVILTKISKRKQAEEKLRLLITHDSLTGLYNRSFFMEEMARLERGRDFPVSIVMADVDDLKKTNDQEGHAAGDILLKHVAEILTTAFRTEDVVARIGGDEFAVLLPGTDRTAAEVSLQRVRQMIHDNNASGAGTQVHFSLGVSTAQKATLLSGALQEADENMYREKQGKHDP